MLRDLGAANTSFNFFLIFARIRDFLNTSGVACCLVNHPASTTHTAAAAGRAISEWYYRGSYTLSIGLEDI
ncbi:hypothetical protein [Pelosinus propionicus]|uniref:hypothetical protein n=1 Tax=Pelosinus propionicus TaxID=380084 RepID=UPI000B872B95|nr:hypothetical protein [Pelosinus propionicus]